MASLSFSSGAFFFRTVTCFLKPTLEFRDYNSRLFGCNGTYWCVLKRGLNTYCTGENSSVGVGVVVVGGLNELSRDILLIDCVRELNQ